MQSGPEILLCTAERNIASSRSDGEDEDEDEGYESGDEAEPLEAGVQSSIPDAQPPAEDASPALQDPGPSTAAAPSGLSMAEKNPAVELESGAGLMSDHKASIEERDIPDAGEGEPTASNGASASTQPGDAGQPTEANGQPSGIESKAGAAPVAHCLGLVSCKTVHNFPISGMQMWRCKRLRQPSDVGRRKTHEFDIRSRRRSLDQQSWDYFNFLVPLLHYE